MFGLRVKDAAVLIVICLAAFCLVGYLQISGDRYQRDFTTFYTAAELYAQGGNPYDLTALQRAAGTELLPFLYPPLTLPVFRVFTALPLPTARTVWLWLRVGLLLLLFRIWRKHFVDGESAWGFYLLAMFAFGGAILLDLKAGNISIVEQLLLWSGFVFLLKDRPLPFCALVLIAAVFKGLPILFLLLLPLLRIRHGWRYLVGSAVALLMFHLANYLIYAATYVEYIRQAIAWDERGVNKNPSTLALFKDLWEKLHTSDASSLMTQVLPLITLLGVALVILYSGRRVYRSVRNSGGNAGLPALEERLALIFLSTLAYGLLAPRFKLYSFILVLPAAYYVIRRYAAGTAILIWLILLSLPVHPAFPMGERFLAVFAPYYPLLTLYLVWGCWVYTGDRAGSSKPVAGGLTGSFRPGRAT